MIRFTKLVIHDLRRSKLRNLLSAITMFLGIIALVGISAGSSIATDMLLAAEEQAEGRANTYTAQVEILPEDVKQIFPPMYSILTERLGQNGVVLLSTEMTMFVRDVADISENVMGTPIPTEWELGNLSLIRRIPIISGVFPLHDTAYPPEIAINQSAAQRLGYDTDSAQKDFMFSETNDPVGAVFKIVAVLADGSDEPRAYGNLSSYFSLFSSGQNILTNIRISSKILSESQINQILHDSLEILNLELNEPARRTDTTWRVALQIDTLEKIFIYFSLLMLLVSAIGLLNVGLSSLKERSRELVIRRAIGARRRDIFILVMASALSLGALVAISATGTALLAVYAIIPRIFADGVLIASPAFPWMACIVGGVASLTTAALGAVVPATKASRLPVAQALRE